MTRINLWSSPRNVSTALMYSFAQRADTLVVDEPLYAHYLSVTGKEHPGKREILSSLENDGAKVVKSFFEYQDKEILFLKQMTHHLVQLDKQFLLEMKNVLFIRDPGEIINSYSKVINKVEMEDIGILAQYELYNWLISHGAHCTVLDSRTLLEAPQSTLTALCEDLGIAFGEGMLHWQAGPRIEDGVWAKFWYSNVHASTGFKKYVRKEVLLNDELQELELKCKPYFEVLKSKAIDPLKIRHS